MQNSSSVYFRTAIALAAIVFFALLPYVGFAHTETGESQLSSTIRAELLSDPRTSGLSHEEVDTMVSLLTQEAEKQGVTVQDIQWRPQNTQGFTSGDEVSAASECSAYGFLCMFNEAFGFTGSDPTIPFVLGAGSMGLVWIIAEMLHRRRHGWGSTPASM